MTEWMVWFLFQSLFHAANKAYNKCTIKMLWNGKNLCTEQLPQTRDVCWNTDGLVLFWKLQNNGGFFINFNFLFRCWHPRVWGSSPERHCFQLPSLSITRTDQWAASGGSSWEGPLRQRPCRTPSIAHSILGEMLVAYQLPPHSCKSLWHHPALQWPKWRRILPCLLINSQKGT